jgi:alpha/beta hydrolase family protein
VLVLGPSFLARNVILDALRREPMPHFVNRPIDNPMVVSACAGAKPSKVADFEAAAQRGECAYAVASGAVLAAEFHDGPYGRVPAFVARPPDVDLASAPLVVVDLVGGPGGGVFPSLEYGEYRKFSLRRAADGILTITPSYMGTMTRSLYPRSDLPVAMKEIAHLLRDLQNRRAGRPICMVGGSLGGYLAIRLSRLFPDVEILAINPLLWSPRKARETTLSIHGQHVKYYYSPVRKHELRDGHAYFVREELETHMEVFNRFFEPDDDKGLSDLVDPAVKNVTLVYSPADDRIGVEEVPRLRRRAPGIRIIETRPVGHMMGSVRNFWAYRPALTKFLEDCRSRAGRPSRIEEPRPRIVHSSPQPMDDSTS